MDITLAYSTELKAWTVRVNGELNYWSIDRDYCVIYIERLARDAR